MLVILAFCCCGLSALEASNVAIDQINFGVTNDSLASIERRGDRAAENGKYEKAKNFYKQLVDSKSDNAEYHFKYGAALGLYAKEVSKFKALGMLDDIKFHLKRAIELDKNHIEARHALSQMYCELPGIVGGSYNNAQEYAEQLLKISPVDGYLALGFVAEHQENYDKAAKHYNDAIEVGQSVTTYRKLILLNEKKLDNPRKALYLTNKALAIHPSSDRLKQDKIRLGKQV